MITNGRDFLLITEEFSGETPNTWVETWDRTAWKWFSATTDTFAEVLKGYSANGWKLMMNKE